MSPGLFINTISLIPSRGEVTAGNCSEESHSGEIWLTLALGHSSSTSPAAASALLSSSEAGHPWEICDAGREIMQDMRYGMQDARGGIMQDAGYGMRDAGCGMQAGWPGMESWLGMQCWLLWLREIVSWAAMSGVI